MDINSAEVPSDEDLIVDEQLPELEPLHLEESFSFMNDVLQRDLELPGEPVFEPGTASDQGLVQEEGGGGDSWPIEAEVDHACTSEGTNNIEMNRLDWNMIVTSSFEQYKQVDPTLKLPWENAAMRGLFNQSLALSPPRVHGVIPQLPDLVEEKLTPPTLGGEIAECGGAAYLRAVSDIKDLDYIENKDLQTELVCSKWMDILSIDWQGSSIGKQVCLDLRADPSGGDAAETIRAAFGTKSYSTLQKRANALKRYILWHRDFYCDDLQAGDVFPLREIHVWDFFKHLREIRLVGLKGYTAPATFLETVRFCKFTIDLAGADDILTSRRLQGFAALGKRAKGPTKQSPPLELEHLQRLHGILQSDANIVDRIGAGCMLICIYGRARWSDLRYIDHIEVESRRNGCFVLYTREHKTSSIGDRREQYLPLVVPWEGVTNDNWLDTFLHLYLEAGLDIQKTPLGPLLPAPKAGGGFCARPLRTLEASKWLRELLQGTKDCGSIRAHSMKATLLSWCARAGVDKEIRAVLGHHCSALTGSDVVYSRNLQIRPVRKLQMLLRLIRIGMGLEDIADQGQISSVTPACRTPAPQLGVHGTAVCGTGPWAEALLEYHLTMEATCNTKAWFARVATEANLSDYPSRQCEHPLLVRRNDRTRRAFAEFASLHDFVSERANAHGERRGTKDLGIPRSKRGAADF